MRSPGRRPVVASSAHIAFTTKFDSSPGTVGSSQLKAISPAPKASSRCKLSRSLSPTGARRVSTS